MYKGKQVLLNYEKSFFKLMQWQGCKFRCEEGKQQERKIDGRKGWASLDTISGFCKSQLWEGNTPGSLGRWVRENKTKQNETQKTYLFQSLLIIFLSKSMQQIHVSRSSCMGTNVISMICVLEKVQDLDIT